MRPIHAKLVLITAAATALPAPVTDTSAIAAPASHAIRATTARRDLPEPPPADVVRKAPSPLRIR